MDVGAGAASPRSGSCNAIKLFLEKMYSGGFLRGGSWVAYWPAENHILAPVATGTITTISEHPEISGAPSSPPSPADCTGILRHGKDTDSCEKKSEKANKEAKRVSEKQRVIECEWQTSQKHDQYLEV